MKSNKAFSVAEILLVVAILGIIAMLVLNVINGQDNLQKEFMSRYEMTVPKLTDMASMAAQNTNTYENWWADSGSLSGLDCDAENHSDCLKRAFMSISSTLQDCPDGSTCYVQNDADETAIKNVFNSMSKITTENLAVATLPGDVTLGFLYNDMACNTDIKGDNGRSIRSCGLIFIDVNGKEPPNRLPTENDNFADRFLVAVTKNSVEQTEFLNISAACAAGTVWNSDKKACINYNCSAQPDAIAYANKLIDANPAAYNLVTKIYPDGEENTGCYTARCRTGERPNADLECPDICRHETANAALGIEEGDPNGLTHDGGLYLSEGGTIEDFEWDDKECCIPVSNQADLNAIRNNLSGTYCLTNDIDFDLSGAGVSSDGKGWLPIGTDETPFTGKLYGNGHKISNLTISQSSACGGSHGGACSNIYMGLFAATNRATIKDLELTNINYSFEGGSPSTSAIVRLGGIVGHAAIKGNNTTGTDTPQANYPKIYVGGISGESGNVINAINATNINLTDIKRAELYVGGSTGYTGINNKVTNIGSITINPNDTKDIKIGGICGFCNVYDSINIGNINTSGDVGSDTSYVGGIIGYGVGKTISNVANLGTITNNTKSSNKYTGGIVGAMATSGNSATGSITNVIVCLSGGACHSAGSCNTSGTCTNTAVTSMDIAGYLGSSGMLINNNTSLIAPPIFLKDSRISPQPTGHYDVLNTQNVFIRTGDTLSPFAYEKPNDATPTSIPLFRWQCKPYREDGLDCCRPSYANWEPELSICPAP